MSDAAALSSISKVCDSSMWVVSIKFKKMTGCTKDNMMRYLSFLGHKNHITQCFLCIYVACQQGSAVSFSQHDCKLTLGINPWVDCRFNYSWVVNLNHYFWMLFMILMKPANLANFFSLGPLFTKYWGWENAKVYDMFRDCEWCGLFYYQERCSNSLKNFFNLIEFDLHV